ncbi:MAG: YkgJ family cysteine cluster protein [Proteobacteria bacterium]|nr:YkgJ family cysteine cluster protein [Pseudomonadota bacterium]MBU1687955.1 YkgJ family cysteine cluster protein [Pseudomonadota bacterium]
MSLPENDFKPGLDLLKSPILPLVRLAQLLYLTGPFDRVEELLAELHEPLETATISYENPGNELKPYLAPLKTIESLKFPREENRVIRDETGAPVAPLEALDAWIAQEILTMELETINSLLCRPCGCMLCCIGPDGELSQEYFEIPLDAAETSLFDLPVLDTPSSRSSTPEDEPPFAPTGRPFYREPSGLYHWQSGWSLVLPRGTSCPALTAGTGSCRIYPERPLVCRRPQIFPYMLERLPKRDPQAPMDLTPEYTLRRKILAVWDCPYVKRFQDQITRYAELCEMEILFRENKA